MVKFKTESDVIEYVNNDKTRSYEPEFVQGARWSIGVNEEYIQFLLSKIDKQSKKINEYAEKINDYNSMFYGEDVTPTRGKKKKKQIAEPTEQQESKDEFIAGFFSEDNGFDEEDDEFFNEFEE